MICCRSWFWKEFLVFYLFKKIFNQACNIESKNNKDNVSFTNYQIPKDDLTKYNLKDCINNNINDYKCRYLLLEIRSSISPIFWAL